jgi:hypothetical protein
VTLSFHGLWFLCALGATVFAAVAARRGRDLCGLSLGLLLAFGLVLRGWVPDAALVGGMAAFLAVAWLVRPSWSLALAVGGGALGGVWAGLFHLQGLPAPVALAAAAGVMTLSAVLARRRPEFAPEILREEALLTMAVLGAGVAALPAVLDGWAAAANLTAVPAAGEHAAVPRWTLLLVGVSLAGGAARSIWSRR